MLKRPSLTKNYNTAVRPRAQHSWPQESCPGDSGQGWVRLGFEDMHGPHDVLAADGALAHPLATLGAGDHVAALQQHAVDHGVHADPAQVVIVLVQLHLLPLWKPTEREVTALGPAEPGQVQPSHAPSPHMSFLNPQLQINPYSSKNKQRNKN